MNEVAHIVKAQYLHGYVLRLTYRDGFVDDYDFEPLLTGRMSNALRDLSFFKRVSIESGGGLEWPNGYDVCPDLLRYHLEPASAANSSGRLNPATGLANNNIPVFTDKSEICWFLGISIEMSVDEHPNPHFHATYQDLEPNPHAVFDIETLQIIEGGLSDMANGFVVEWAIDHRKELFEDWERAKQGLPLNKIEELEGTF
jgi:hypothetical protein